MKAITAIMLLILPIFALAAEPVWIDVRTAGEFNGGHLDVAVNIPHGEVATAVPALVKDKDATIYVYCRSGNRAGIAQRVLEAEGYTHVTNLGSLNDAREFFAKQSTEAGSEKNGMTKQAM